ncbi:MAG TPA: serine/threonine-protein kinase [Polyangiaceae bacterium]
MHPIDPRLLALRDLLPGRVFEGTRGARFHLKERIGEGGQGWVFTAAWDEPDGYIVIVKVLRPDAVSPESLSRFEREAQVLRMLGQAARPNPHIVRFFDHASARVPSPGGGEPVELRFTALEYVRGPTLEHVLAQSRGAGIGLDRTRRIGRQVALALEDVHAHKIVHRDLKPSNVLLASETGGEIAKVTDFGLVKLVDMGLGKTTALAGASLGYAPPEQFEQGNRRVNVRTDVFSFAAILFEMLTGVKAFPYGDGENPLIIVTRLLNGPRPSLTTNVRGALPQELAMRRELVERLDAILVRATAAEPADRQASIGELWGTVEPLLRAASERRSFSPVAVGAPSTTPAAPGRPGPAEGEMRPGETLDTTARTSTTPPDTDAQLASPAAWKWRVCVPSVRAGAVRTAAFDAGGEAAVAIGATGIVRWEGAAWTRLSSTPELDARGVRGLAWLRAGELVAYGARGLAARLVPGGALETWELADQEVTFLGANVDPQGTTVTLVGERPARRAVRGGGQSSTMGMIAQFARGKLTLLAEAPSSARLRGVTRLRSGNVVACGDWGAVVRLEMGVPEHVGSICGGHLNAIAAVGDGAVTVGAGGHALSLSARLQAQLEAVQTTRDLLALAVDAAGVAWSGSAQARLLRRTAGSWVRMSGELGLQSSVVALWAAPRTVRAICDDGAVIEGIVA